MASDEDLVNAFTRKLAALQPNTRYVARVRAFSGLGVPSDWSEALVFDTPSDSSVPGPIRNLEINFSTSTLFLDWDSPTNNTDGTVLADLAHYAVILSNGTKSVTYITKNSFFSYTIEKNTADYLTPQPELDVTIFAVDVTGNASPAVTAVAINEEPQDPPLAPTTASAFTIVNISMSPHPEDEDITQYLLHHSTDGISYTFLATTGSNYTHEVTAGSTHFYKFKTRDVFGQESENFSPASQTTTQTQEGEDLTPPDAPEDFEAYADDGNGTFFVDPVTRRPYIETEWTPVQNSTLARYELVVRRTGANEFVRYFTIPPQASTFRVADLEENTAYRLILYAYSQAGIRSGPSTEVFVSTGFFQGQPDVPTGFTTVPGFGTVTTYWNPHPDPYFQVFEVYASLNAEDLYGGATPIDEPDPAFRVFVGNATSYVHQGTSSNQKWYFRIRAVNRFGTKSDLVPTTDPEEFTGTTASGVDAVDPAAPDNVVLTPGVESNSAFDNYYIDVEWDPVVDTDVAGYMVRLAEFGTTTFSYQVVHSDTTYARFGGLKANTMYSAQVAAFDTSGNYSAFSAVESDTTPGDTDAPPALGNVLARGGVKSILLEWDASTVVDFSHYKIHIGTTENFTPSEDNLYDKPGVGTIALVEKYYDDTLATPGWTDLVAQTRYYIKMQAVDRSGNTGPYRDAYDAQNTAVKGAVVGQVGDNDIEELYVDKLRSGNLTAAVALLGIIRTATSGARLELDSEGIIGYSNDGATPNFEYTTVDQPSRGMLAGDVRIRGALKAGSSIEIGMSPNKFVVDSSGFMWFGADSFIDAPFRVSNTGSVRTSDIVITGNPEADPSDLLINSPNFQLTQGGTVLADNLIANGGLIAGAMINPTITAVTTTGVNIPDGGLIGGEIYVDDVSLFTSPSGTFVLGGYAFTYTGIDLVNNRFTGVQGGIPGVIPTGTTAYQGGLVGGLFQAPNILIPTGGGIQFTGDGNITWGASSEGRIIIGGQGSIQSGNFSSSSMTGYYFGPEGIIVYDGVIQGANLQIGVSSENLFINSSFENDNEDNGIADNWAMYTGNATATFLVTDEENLFQARVQRIEVTDTTGPARAGVYQDIYPLEALFPTNTPVAISAYVRQFESGASLRSAKIYVATVDPDTLVETLVWNGNVGGQSTDIDQTDQWQRISTVFRTSQAYENLRVYFWFNSVEEGDIFFIDGAQVHLSDYVSDFAPRALDIPANYIQDVHISTLSADKIRTGYLGPPSMLGSVDIVMGPNGTITSIDPDNLSGWLLNRDGALFQNGSIQIFAGGEEGAPTGYVKIDGTGLQLLYGNDTKFRVDGSGVFIGGDDETNADVFFDGSRTVFQSIDGYSFIIDTMGIPDPDNNEQDRVLQLKDALDNENFYLTRDGLAYFRGGIIGLGNGVGFNVDNAGNMWVGHPTLGLAPFAIYAQGDIFLRSKKIHVGGVDGSADAWIGSSNLTADNGWRIYGDGTADFRDLSVRGHIEAESGYFRGTLEAQDGYFYGYLYGNDIEAATFYSGYIEGAVIVGSLIRTSIEPDAGRVELRAETETDRSRMSLYYDATDQGSFIHAVKAGDEAYSDLARVAEEPTLVDRDGLLIRASNDLQLEGKYVTIVARDLQTPVETSGTTIPRGHSNRGGSIRVDANSLYVNSPTTFVGGGQYMTAPYYLGGNRLSNGAETRNRVPWEIISTSYAGKSVTDLRQNLVALDASKKLVAQQRPGTSFLYARQDHEHVVWGTSHTHTEYSRKDHSHASSGIGTEFTTLASEDTSSATLDARFGGVRVGTLFVHAPSGGTTLGIIGPLRGDGLFVRDTLSGKAGLLCYADEVRVISNSGNIDSFRKIRGIHIDASSRDIKHDIAPAGTMLDRLMDVNIVEFAYNDHEPDQLQLGVIAEEIELVDTRVGRDGAVLPTGLAAMAIKGVQELVDRLAALEAEVTRLKES